MFMFLDNRREDKMFWTERQQALPEFYVLLIFSWNSILHAQLIWMTEIETRRISRQRN
jgi:hypothetical protein